MYDERGRPVNQETKRINKEVVRSHNEVMHVIGVVEPENGGVVDSQADARLKQQINGDKIGQRLWDVGISFHLYGFWALNGLRQRLLVSALDDDTDPRSRRLDLPLVCTNPVLGPLRARAEPAFGGRLLLRRPSHHCGQ